ncbi:MAG: DNA-3-methyladenine glycosylase I [Phenylobacterium sp.]|jgi:DNA-3-methyladenine glycosylase I
MKTMNENIGKQDASEPDINEQQPCRCPWVDLSKPDYVDYHDKEWGVPVYDDQKQFEFMTLESAQAGLSWYSILKRRDNYRQAFADFDVAAVAKFDQAKIAELLNNPGIIRNKLKIHAAVSNAQQFLDIQREFGSFNQYLWSFVGGKPIVNHFVLDSDYPSSSAESEALSKDLKRRGFKFVGPTICYSHLQAAGLINDHSLKCFRRQEIIDSYK